MRVTRTGDLQHCNNHFDDEPIRMDANCLALGEKHDELFRGIELAPIVRSVRLEAHEAILVRIPS